MENRRQNRENVKKNIIEENEKKRQKRQGG